MISEVQNLLNGQVIVTPEFVGNKKIIGISASNLTPTLDGSIPLSKQNAFEKVNTQTNVESFTSLQPNNFQANPQFQNNMSMQMPNMMVNQMPGYMVNPMASFPNGQMLNQPQAPYQQYNSQMQMPMSNMAPNQNIIQGRFIPTPSAVSDTMVDAPITVENPEKLDGIIDTKTIMEQSIPFESVMVEEKKDLPDLDLKMPEMDKDVSAIEPTTVDNSLFETNEQKEEKELPSEMTLEELKDYIEKKTEKFKVDLSIIINKNIDEFKQSIVEAVSKVKVKNGVQNMNFDPNTTSITDSNSIMNDALSQIQNIPLINNNMQFKM